MLRAFYIRQDRPGAGGDEDIFRRDFAAAGELDAVRTGHGRAFGDHLDLVAAERIFVEAFEPVDLAQHIVAQRRPFEPAIGHVPAKAARVLQILGEMRAIDEQLLGHAAANDAGAADAKLLGHRDLRAMPRCDAGGAHAARSCTDDEKVEIIVAHAWPPLGCGRYGGWAPELQTGILLLLSKPMPFASSEVEKREALRQRFSTSLETNGSTHLVTAQRQFDQRHGRGVEPLGTVGLDRLGDFLAQFHAELVERVDAHQHGVGEGAMLVEGD